MSLGVWITFICLLKAFFQERTQTGFQRILGNWLSQRKRWLGDSVLWRVSQKAWSQRDLERERVLSRVVERAFVMLTRIGKEEFCSICVELCRNHVRDGE